MQGIYWLTAGELLAFQEGVFCGMPRDKYIYFILL